VQWSIQIKAHWYATAQPPACKTEPQKSVQDKFLIAEQLMGFAQRDLQAIADIVGEQQYIVGKQLTVFDFSVIWTFTVGRFDFLLVTGSLLLKQLRVRGVKFLTLWA
jgi:hypothetical protein